MMDIRLNFANQTVIAAGHANAPRNEDGRDLVCCAVSTLIQTLIFTCQEIHGVVVDHSVSPGDVYIKISSPRCKAEWVEHRMQMLLDGLKHLETQYPELIRTLSDK